MDMLLSVLSEDERRELLEYDDNKRPTYYDPYMEQVIEGCISKGAKFKRMNGMATIAINNTLFILANAMSGNMDGWLMT